MPIVTVKVPKLYQRSYPATNATDKGSISGVVQKGFKFESKGTVTNEMGLWYKDASGYYYWGGGVTVSDDPVVVLNYKAMLSIDEPWAKTDGINTNIIVIDTGITSKAPAFNTSIVTEHDLTAQTSVNREHGTFVSGIVSGYQGPIAGIAPGATVLAIRYKDENTQLKVQLANMSTALQQAVAMKTAAPAMKMLVNISQGFNSFQVSNNAAAIEEIAGMIRKLDAIGGLIVCAAGDNEQLAEGSVLFPASMPETIGVGGITATYAGNNFPTSVDIVLPLNEYTSFDSDLNMIKDTGSSFCTAVVTGMAALVCSGSPSMPDRHQFINTIALHSMPMTTFDYGTLSRIQFKTTQA